MKRRRLKTFLLLVLAYFSTIVTNGNAKFGDYLKKRLENTNHTVNLNITNSTQNEDLHTNAEYQKSAQPRRENFEVREVRIYGTNPSPMYQNLERKMLESLFPDNALQPGQDFDLRKQIYGPDLKDELDSLLEHTSPSWDQLQALLKKADKVTRLPQSMYDDYNAEGARTAPDMEFKNLHNADSDKFNAEKNSSKKEDLSMGTMFKRYLQMPNSMDDLSMDFGGGHQVYPFAGDFSLSDAIIRNKREIQRDNNFSKYPSDGRTVNYQSFGQPRQSYFKGVPLVSQFFRTSKFVYNSFRSNYHLKRENEARVLYTRSSSQQNLKNHVFTRINSDSNFPRFPLDRRAVNHQSFRQPQQSYFRSPPTWQFPTTIKFAYSSFRPTNSHLGSENDARKFYATSSFRQNSKNDNFSRNYHKITSRITKLTPHGTFDATWKDLVQQMNPIQQKIIQDLFLHGPPTRSDHNVQTTRTSLSNFKMDGKLINSSLISQNSISVSTSKFLIREIDRRSTPRIHTTVKNSFTYDQVWITKSTIPTYTSPKLRTTVMIDKSLMKEWLKSLNPQDREEMENIFFNGQSSPLYDINDAESIKNAIKNDFFHGTRKPFGGFSTNNPKSTYISRKDNKKWQAEDTGVGYYNYEDLSRLLKQAPQDKLKIVDDWCDEIERDLHRRFPTGTTKYGETRNLGPFPSTRYYPWELFSMLPNQN